MPTAIDFAKTWVELPVRESNGPNRSPQVDEFNRFVGDNMGDPWCAAFVSYCFHEAGAGEAFPYSGGSQTLKAWFKDHDLFSTDPNDLKGWSGALAGWTDPGGEQGHIFFVYGRGTDGNGNVVSLLTYEGNTNTDGSSNGDGAYARNRPVDSREFWYLRTDGIPGGSWW